MINDVIHFPATIALIKRVIESKIFPESPADTGKTTAGVGRLLHLLAAGVPAGPSW
jgi:hypothetical protein